MTYEVRETLPLVLTLLTFLCLAARQLGRPPRSVFYGDDALLANRPQARKIVDKVVWVLVAIVVAGFFFGIPVLQWMSFVLLGVLLLGAYILAFTTVKSRCVAFLFALATLTAWFLWPNWLTTDVLALLMAFTIIALFQQATNVLFVPAAAGGLLLLVYDVYTHYVTRSVEQPTLDAVARWSPRAVVVPAHLGLDAPVMSWLGTGDFACIGLIIVGAAVVARRDRRIHLVVGGLVGCVVGFVVIEALWLTMGQSQPALLGLYPGTMAGILLVAWRTGKIGELMVRPRKQKVA